jgi:hypothetical protein
MSVVALLIAILLLIGVSVAIAVAGAACVLGLARLERRVSLVPARVDDRRHLRR